MPNRWKLAKQMKTKQEDLKQGKKTETNKTHKSDIFNKYKTEYYLNN